MSGDLTARDHIVKKIRLLSDRYKIEDLVRLAVENRPELKQYEELRLAAKRAIPVAGAALQPTFAFNGNIYGIGPGISHVQALYLLGLNFQWNLEGMGTVAYSNVQSARMQARQALLQENKELVTVIDQVRSTFLQSLDAERKIEETSNEVASTLEELRLARLRYQHGLGNNIDIFVAQRDYTQALINKAQAIINFNIQQSQLVHDVGLVSMDNLMPGHVLSPTPPAATP